MPAFASPAAERLRPRNAASFLGLLAVGVAIAFLGFMLAATSGHAVPQIVDLYVVCQYAKSFAEGHAFAYNAGEAASTGSTSLLYTAFLGLAHAVGFRGEGLVAFAIVSGAVLFVASVLIARRIGVRLGGEREGILAGALIALGGPVAWGYLYGSDIGLFMFLTLWLLDRLLAGPGRGSRPRGSCWPSRGPKGSRSASSSASPRTCAPGRHPGAAPAFCPGFRP
jgi:hypothetical protein